MLRITRVTKDNAIWLRLEGKLAGQWVDEFRSAFAAASLSGEPPSLDLSEVSFVDRTGQDFLQQLALDGVPMPLRSNFVAELLRLEQS